jgi:hypothetical protein
MKKYEWRKEDKALYLPKNQPTKIDIQKIKYFTVIGHGHPENEDFAKAVESLYSTSYFIRMMHKKGTVPDGYYEYTVFPLEGIWDLDEEGRKLDYLDKNHFVYKLMIRQPDFVNKELFEKAVQSVKEKKDNSFLDKVEFEEIEEGMCVQMMHLGSYDDEPKSFKLMENYCAENNLTRIEKTHKEIYISDPRKTTEQNRKTVLRFKVK